MNPESYKNLLDSIKHKGYRFVSFSDFDSKANSQVLLRHDADFSVEYAFKMAELEASIGVLSTYYFLLSSDSYNALSPTNAKLIKGIKSMGHATGLHFDPTVYGDEQSGFFSEMNIFQEVFGDLSLMSFHRPSKTILEGVDWLPDNIIGAYQRMFFKDITYISDSGGEFKFGHPLKSNAYERNLNIQLLIHPVWWLVEESDPIAKLKKFLTQNNESMSKHISKNCKPWASHVS